MPNNLRASGKFERVDINNALAQNKRLASFQRESAGNAGLDFGKVMLGAVTLFLVPMPYDYLYQANSRCSTATMWSMNTSTVATPRK